MTMYSNNRQANVNSQTADYGIGRVNAVNPGGSPKEQQNIHSIIYVDAENHTLKVISEQLPTYVSIYSIDGRLIKKWLQPQVDNQLEQSMTRGIYIIEYETNQQVIRKKIIVE